MLAAAVVVGSVQRLPRRTLAFPGLVSLIASAPVAVAASRRAAPTGGTAPCIAPGSTTSKYLSSITRRIAIAQVP